MNNNKRIKNKGTFVRKSKSWWDVVKRIINYRLIIPLKRTKHPAEYTARGVGVGTFCAMTPTFGFQMLQVFLIWLSMPRVHKDWDFNLVIALAWTWITNIITVGPVYYVYILTGNILLGRFDQLGSYNSFRELMPEASVQSINRSWFDSATTYLYNLFEIFGLPLIIGCIPWVIVSTWWGYKWSLRFVRKRREKIKNRMALKMANESSQKDLDSTDEI